MSEIAGIIDTLEGRIKKLLTKIDVLEQSNGKLKLEIKNSNEMLAKSADEAAGLRSAVETLKMTNALLGSEENKRDTKLKINTLIREIDYCISQLAD